MQEKFLLVSKIEAKRLIDEYDGEKIPMLLSDFTKRINQDVQYITVSEGYQEIDQSKSITLAQDDLMAVLSLYNTKQKSIEIRSRGIVKSLLLIGE